MSQTTITIDEMWRMMNKQEDAFGIEGYNPLKVYHKNKTVSQYLQKDKEGNLIKPQRGSYLDEVNP